MQASHGVDAEMNIEFERSTNAYKPCFNEKHVVIVQPGMTITDMLGPAKLAYKYRTLVDKKAKTNSTLAWTVDQCEAMFSWLIKNKSAELNAIKKGDGYVEVAGIQSWGWVLTLDDKKTLKARVGGTLTLGITRYSASKCLIVHFGGHNWTGSFGIAPNAVVPVP